LNVSTAPGDFHTIQAAVNAAMNDDTIEIAPGTYREQVTINGKPVSGATPGQYLALRRRWSPGDLIDVKFGMTPAQAIRAATSSAADLIGRSKDVGTIEAGKFADLIAVSADPLQNVRALENVGFVMKGGKIYKDTIEGK